MSKRQPSTNARASTFRSRLVYLASVVPIVSRANWGRIRLRARLSLPPCPGTPTPGEGWRPYRHLPIETLGGGLGALLAEPKQGESAGLFDLRARRDSFRLAGSRRQAPEGSGALRQLGSIGQSGSRRFRELRWLSQLEQAKQP